MPEVESWVRDEVSRYDNNLDVLWGCSSSAVKVMGDPLQRFIVTCKTNHGTDVLMILQTKDGDYIKPHPKIILYGNDELGIQGLATRDFTKNGGWRRWFDSIHQNEVEHAKHKRRILKARNDAFARDIWNSSLMNPRVFVKSPIYKENGNASQ